MTNSTAIISCTLDTCSIEDAKVRYVPTLFGNSFYIAIFAVLLAAQIYQGTRYRTWTFMGAIFGGLVLEIIGYVGRIQMHYNPFLSDPFLLYLICLTIGPTFLSGAIYICLARIVVVYGEEYSRFKPRTYTLVFITCDIISLILQAVGGAIADLATTRESQDLGVHIMVGGLSFQVASLLLFTILCADFAWSLRMNKSTIPRMDNRTFNLFLYSLGLATFCIFVRSCFRVAELSEGFGGSLANDQITFMILEGAMIITSSIALTTLHPGRAFAGGWKAAGYKFRTRNHMNSEDVSAVDQGAKA